MKHLVVTIGVIVISASAFAGQKAPASARQAPLGIGRRGDF